MIIGLDYDDTFSTDPEAWSKVARILYGAGYLIIGATLRNRYQVIEDTRYFDVCSHVVYCAGHAKAPLLAALGFPVTVWIDDKPQYITQTYKELTGKVFAMDVTHADTYEPMVVSCP